ncbi:MAG: hypothetical protein ACRD59_18445, partial [Candidatus Acidiferrales bacterium]
VMRVEQPVVPVFKGVFAFESEYKSDVSIAERIRTFHNGLQADGHISRRHRYLMQGVTAVCVPHHNYVFQRYTLMEDENTFPQPQLFSLQPEWPGDVRTGAFLGQLLSHLDIEPGPKRSQGRSFAPIFQECSTELLKALFGENWQATMANSSLSATLEVAGARKYVARVEAFFAGLLSASEIAAGLTRAATGQRGIGGGPAD